MLQVQVETLSTNRQSPKTKTLSAEPLEKPFILLECVIVYCKTTNFSVLLILAILANGIITLILIPANIYNQSRGRTR